MFRILHLIITTLIFAAKLIIILGLGILAMMFFLFIVDYLFGLWDKMRGSEITITTIKKKKK